MRSARITHIAWLILAALELAIGGLKEAHSEITHSPAHVADPAGDIPLAIAGGTLIDVRDYGRSTADIANSTILIRSGGIEGGRRDERCRRPNEEPMVLRAEVRDAPEDAMLIQTDINNSL
jgi:hypothetical protein